MHLPVWLQALLAVYAVGLVVTGVLTLWTDLRLATRALATVLWPVTWVSVGLYVVFGEG